MNRSKTDCQYYWELALKEARKVEPGWSPRRGGYMFDRVSVTLRVQQARN